MSKLMCPECYNPDKDSWPLVGERECLAEHEQYICGTCGRCICIDKHPARNLRRFHFPFSTLALAVLYLRTADYVEKKSCGIYEITSHSGRKSWKIFISALEKEAYKCKNRDKRVSPEPVYQKECYREFPHTQIRKLTHGEVEQYLARGKFVI